MVKEVDILKGEGSHCVKWIVWGKNIVNRMGSKWEKNNLISKFMCTSMEMESNFFSNPTIQCAFPN